MFELIIESQANVLAAIAATEGEEAAQKAFNEAIAKATGQLDEERAEAAKLAQDLEAKITALEAEKAKVSEDLESANTRISELEAEAENDGVQIDAHEAAIADLENKLVEAEKANKILAEKTEQKPAEIQASISDDEVLDKAVTGDELWERQLKKAAQRQQVNQN